MIKSLRWKLLVWYACILLALTCIFGGLLFHSIRRLIERDVDGLLTNRGTALAGVMIPVGNGKFYTELTPEQFEYYSSEGPGAAYYAIWNAAGEIVDFSDPTLQLSKPGEIGSRNRDQFRELILRGPGDAWVLVGKDIGHERQQLKSLALVSIGVGSVAFLLMLLGGSFITSRALAPIERISRATAAVSGSNLSTRIDLTNMEMELAGLAGTINDAFDRLELAFEQQTRFTADASHELRTPLSIILSHAELALKKSRSEDEYREALTVVLRSARRMKRVVEGLLTLARADAGRIQLQTERLDLLALVEEVCGMLEPIAAEKHISIHQQLAPAFVIGDRERLSEAIINVLLNAVRYNQENGRIEVVLNIGPSDVCLQFVDTGSGILADDIPHIFDRFYRADKSRTRNSIEGSGLGLAITKWIVESHGGSISCRGNEHGGSTFTIQLPSEEVRDAS